MTNNNIQQIIILGGGTAGWMTAASLSRFLTADYQITLIESDSIGSVGVGEATIPQIQVFNKTLGINEDDFIKKTQGTFKLGIEFVNWGQIGDSYIHGFGHLGQDMSALPFHHYWWKLRQQNQAKPLADYALNCSAAYQNKFMRSIDAGNSPLSDITYAYQFDAGLYAQYLKEYAMARGVNHVIGDVESTSVNAVSELIESISLKSGEILKADFFIDCSGMRALLIEKTLNIGYENWQHWLPCDSALAVPSKKIEPLPPYTRSTAHSAGWQWRIPLQHRTGNGHVFCSEYMQSSEAEKILLDNLDTEALQPARLIQFTTGKRKAFWHKNCVAIGLSSGFMEPLESTSIHLIQSAIARLMSLFPDKSFHQANIDEFNRQTHFEYDSIRDFIILHYKATQREDSVFWRYCKNMSVPDSLKEKLELFQQHGHVNRFNNELFNENSWVEVLFGQNIEPKGYHPMVDIMPTEQLKQNLAGIENVVKQCVDYMPSQQAFINQFCKAE
ncbi:tryptophan 7-halogenase [Catenovulum sp. 2E275]|uniref:tryptophan halogenase family protein n=1 Tax=Catenovulum sp. 2E275 TaxID=2980497 RepID=UPI0021D0664E|nr:tryptophan halogenase family protein [Catenovulum sp. 2E275]MCU4674049.1 tryptophan 7-halogenase [Catenovulum sp. 2E275]